MQVTDKPVVLESNRHQTKINGSELLLFLDAFGSKKSEKHFLSYRQKTDKENRQRKQSLSVWKDIIKLKWRVSNISQVHEKKKYNNIGRIVRNSTATIF